jgi:hypothetical protein
VRAFHTLLVLGSLAVSPAFPDIITNVSVLGSVSGTGTTTGECGVYAPGTQPPECTVNPVPGLYFESDPFSFSGTNIQLGFFDQVGQGTGRGSSLGAAASQTTSAAPDSLLISLVNTIDPIGPGQFFAVALDNEISLTFTLTVESLVQLTDLADDVSISNQLLDSHGNVIFVLPSNGSPSLVLQPGTYEFKDSLSNGCSFCGQMGNELDVGLEVNAQFTAIIPEPRWAWILLIALRLGKLRRLNPSVIG